MSRELFTKTVPIEPGFYWARFGKSDLGVIRYAEDEPSIRTMMGWFSTEQLSGMILFGPRIPSPEELAENAT